MKKLLTAKWFYFLIVLPVTLTTAFYYSLYQTYKYVEVRDQQIFKDAYEIGRYDQLNEDADIDNNKCFQLSKNESLNILLKDYFKDCKTARTMYAIAQAESNGKQFAVGQNDNGSLDGGWLQVNTVHKHKWETNEQFITRMHNLEENIKEAKKVLDREGYNAWTTYKSGKYLHYLTWN
jgi:Lysozyme like domain